jgi:nitroreductase
MAIKQLAKQARSYRRFDPSDPIPAQVLRDLVDTARFVPCGGNQQPIRYRLVTDPSHCADVFEQIAWAGALPDWPGPAEGERPTGYIAMCLPVKKQALMDVGIAAQTIQLAATELGYGCCMLGAIQHDKLRTILNLPDDYVVSLLLALGKPAEKIVLETVEDSGQTRYWRDEQDVHHVPKRTMEQVIFD